MSESLTISERLLARLKAAARRRGLSSVEQLLEKSHGNLSAMAEAWLQWGLSFRDKAVRLPRHYQLRSFFLQRDRRFL